MNERILELYQQAHMVREYPEDDPMRGGNPPTVYWGGERSAEKFAELLIRECCYVGEQYAEGLFDMEHYDFVNKKIKEHFGVK